MLMISGSVGFAQEIDPSLLPKHLAECMRSVDADAVEITNNRVTFKGGVFRFVTNWNVLVPFGFGDVTVDPETRAVVYGLSYRQLAIFYVILISISARSYWHLDLPVGSPSLYSPCFSSSLSLGL